MRREYFNSLLKSRLTIICVFIIVCMGIFSFLSSSAERRALEDQLRKPASDINIQNAEQILANNKASKLLLDLLYKTLSKDLIIFTYLTFIGIFLAKKFNSDLVTGYGNLLITRTSYLDYVKSIIFVQRKYLFIMIIVPFTILYILAFIINGFNAGIGFMGDFELDVFGVTLLYFGQVLLWYFYFVLINEITLFINAFISNQYIIQTIPTIAFGVLPIFIGSAIPLFGHYFANISLFSLNELTNRAFNNQNPAILVNLVFGYGILLGLRYVFCRYNTAKYKENYIQ